MERLLSSAVSMKPGTLIMRRNEEAENATQAARGDPPPLAHNLQQEFLMVDNQQVEQTPSTNLAVATHELARLPQTPEIL